MVISTLLMVLLVAPQSGPSPSEVGLSALKSDLQTVRSQIELYKIQHMDRLPGSDGRTPPGFTEAGFKDQLVKKTDGTSGLDPQGKFGPYLQTFPKNSLAREGVQNKVTFGTDPSTASLKNEGWYFDTTTGKLHAAGHPNW